MSDTPESKSTPSEKVFKQARLPFKVLDVKSGLPNNVPKKRKLSTEEPTKEAKIAKKDEEPHSENCVNSVNSDGETSDHLNPPRPKRENLNPLTKYFANAPKNSSDTGSTSNVKSKSLSDTNVVASKANSNTTEIDLLSDSCDDNGSEKNETKGDNEGNSSICMDTTKGSDILVSCDEEVADPKDTSLDVSMVSESEAQADVSELDKSICTSAVLENNGTGTEGSTPGVKKERQRRKRSSTSKIENEKRKEEMMRIRLEKEKKLQEAKEAKNREKEREKERKELERNMAKQKKKLEIEEKIKEKEMKKAEFVAKKQAEAEEKLKALEEKKVKKMEAIQAKLDEKKKKDEEKQRRKEEKQKEEEEKQRKQEEKKKGEGEISAKTKAVFASFFIKGAPPAQQPVATEESCGLFKPFEVTKNMVVASITPDDVITQFDKNNLDGCFEKQNASCLYLEELKSGGRAPYKKRKQLTKKVKANDDDDVVILEAAPNTITHHAKLYQFKENVRPPYYGTWTKASATITGRRPFARDTVNFDYEVDSEEEWDEGGPGESLSGTEDEKESEDDYEVDNEFFVPHGYLSADEEKDEEMGVDSAEHQARLKMREHLFQEERKQKFSVLKPHIIGCLWTTAEGDCLSPHQSELRNFLLPYKAIVLCSLPISVLPKQSGESPAKESDEAKGDSAARQQSKRFPEEAMPHLIRLVHANTSSRQIIQNEFMHYWTEFRQKSDKGNVSVEEDVAPVTSSPTREKHTDEVKSGESSPGSFTFNTGFSKRKLELTLNKIASYGRCPDPNYNKCVWWVHEEVRAKYDCTDLPVPNKWCYVSQSNSSSQMPRGRKKAQRLVADALDKLPTTDSETPNKGASTETVNSILKFTCKVTPSEGTETSVRREANHDSEITATPVRSKIVSAKISGDVHGKDSSTEVVPNKNAGFEETNSILKFTCKMSPSQRFEANMPVSCKSPTVTNSPAEQIDSAPVEKNPELDKSVASKKNKAGDISSNSAFHKTSQKESKSPKEAGSILKFTRRITPVNLNSSDGTSSNNQAKCLFTERSDKIKPKSPELVILNEDSAECK